MLFLLFNLAVKAIEIPDEVSMKDMKKLDPSKSASAMLVYYILSYRWQITAVFFFLVFIAMIITIVRSFPHKSEEPEEKEEEIYLEGRKLLLPSHEIFKSGEKFHLSEDFEDAKVSKDPSAIYKATLISQLKLLTV